MAAVTDLDLVCWFQFRQGNFWLKILNPIGEHRQWWWCGGDCFTILMTGGLNNFDLQGIQVAEGSVCLASKN